MPYRQTVSEVMKRTRVQEVNERDSVSKAIHRLDQFSISALPVRSNEGKYVGVISKSDIASDRFLKALAAKRSPDTILVMEIMNRNSPLYVRETDLVRDAIHLMHKHRIHRLFVSNAQYQMIGVISTSDILRLLVLTL